MNLGFDCLNIFYWVYVTKNITKAAQILYISQPAVSQSIKKMEDTIGLSLFTRTKRGVVPTENAKNIFNYLRPAIECINDSDKKFSDIASLEEGTITIGSGTTLAQTFLLPAVKKFTLKYPNIHINIEPGISSKLLRDLEFGRLDLVIANLPLVEKVPNIKLYETRKIQDYFFTSKEFLKSKSHKIKINDLNNYPLILQQKSSHTRLFIDNFCNKYGITLNPQYELGSANLVKYFVSYGLGIGYLPKASILNYSYDFEHLVLLDTDIPIPSREVGLFVRSNFEYNICCEKFIPCI